MRTIEANGRTVEEAVQVAAEQLGVSIEQVEYEVVDHGSKGFLGLGGNPAIINAWVSEQRVAVARPERTYQEEETDTAEPSERIEEPELKEAEAEPESIEPEAETREEPVARPPAPAQPSETGGDFEAALMDTLTDVLSAMKADAKPVQRSSTEEEVVIELVGSDAGSLIGKKGQTLDALQYLAGIIANRSTPTRRRVILDADGYRDKHQRMLERLAREYADAVKAEGKEAVLEPQPARDRRIIHLALADDPDVYTYSEGGGDDRHVVISPKKH